MLAWSIDYILFSAQAQLTTKSQESKKDVKAH